MDDNWVIAGRNAVLEALRSGREPDKLLVVKGHTGGATAPIIAKCAERRIPIKEVDSRKLDFLCEGANHQGVALVVAAYKYASVEEILENAKAKGEKPFIIICDGIEDPHNLGAIIRTAEATGAHGVIIPQRRSASLSPAAAKAACGALEYVPVARVTNLVNTIELLKENGVWVYAADMDGSDWVKENYSDGLALVIGGEGSGVGRLVKDHCDVVVSLPMRGKINSLNASVAAGVLMYEVARQRLNIK
ncbi:MAG: 23S rRNA (guanosine(2251)-2'-O)-methyltransferase RlmB [Clostridia bacterium]|nr:23S rRNA (guanosine(2251)-2'-O)-methyltransferase RlmB [Clostridia bacterium]